MVSKFGGKELLLGPHQCSLNTDLWFRYDYHFHFADVKRRAQRD